MLRIAALVVCLALAVGGSALAAERAPPLVVDNNPVHIPNGTIAAPLHACVTLDKLKTNLKGAKFTALNAGQFHVMEGAYIVLPPLTGFPAADGAMLAQIKDKSFIVWLSGKCLSTDGPMPITGRIVQSLKTISPAVGEIADPDDSSEERKL